MMCLNTAPKMLYCRMTYFEDFKDFYRTSKIFMHKNVRSPTSTAHYLVILKNMLTKYSVYGKFLTFLKCYISENKLSYSIL